MAGVNTLEKVMSDDVFTYPMLDILLIVQGRTPTVFPPAMMSVDRIFVHVVPPRVFVKRT
jgi:hypothetical protein